MNEDIRPTLSKLVSDQSKKFEKNFGNVMKQNKINLNETDELLTEKEQSLKKKIFSLAKMESLVFSDPKLSAVYESMAENGSERYGYHFNETIMNLVFNDYVLNSPKYLQKYKMAIPHKKKRRDKSGINQLKKSGEIAMTKTKYRNKPTLGEEEEDLTKVLFLVNDADQDYGADVFAYFPEENYDNGGYLKTGYAHVGQHTAVSPEYAKESREATPEEYSDLKRELEGQGYNLEVLNSANETTGAGGGGAGAYAPALGYEKRIVEYDENGEGTTEPEDDDCFISSNGNALSVSCGGKFIGKFIEDEDAFNAVKQWKIKNNYYPNTWYVSDHGNMSLVDDEGNIVNETTGAASSGAYAGPAAWGGGDLMKGGKSKVMSKPIWNGGTIIQESDYLTESTGFEKYIEMLSEQIDIDKPELAQKSNVPAYTEPNVNRKIIDKTSAFSSDTVKKWGKADTELEDHTINTGKMDTPNLKTENMENINELSVHDTVEYVSDRNGEEPFTLQNIKWQFVNAKYPDGKIDIGVYRFGHDLVYDYNKWREDMNINEEISLNEQGENLQQFATNIANKNSVWLLPQAMDAKQIYQLFIKNSGAYNNKKGVIAYEPIQQGYITIHILTNDLNLNNSIATEFKTNKGGDISSVDTWPVPNTQIKGFYNNITLPPQQQAPVQEDAQSMIGDHSDSMSNKMQATGTQGSGIQMGFTQSSGLQESLNLFEELNNELDAYSIHHNKLKKMAEDRKPSALVLRDRVGSENEKNFKKDLQYSGTKEIIDIEKELQYKDQQSNVGDDPQKLGNDIEKKALSINKDNTLKNVGNSDNNDGDEVPKRNLTTEEQDEVNMYRLGQQDLVYDNKPSQRFEDRMKADMGDTLYKQRQDKLEFRAKAPMYNKDPQPIEDTTAKKVQFDKEQTGWNERVGLKEHMITGRYRDLLNKSRIIDFTLNEVASTTSTDELFKLDFTGLGNAYISRTIDNKVSVNESVSDALTSHSYYTDGKKVFAVKNPKVSLNENTTAKPIVNEQVNKMKHLLGYKPDSFVNTNSTKRNRGF